jgi:mannose-6-phosphate isomerase-like protein (cupin superfamily)
VVVDLDRLAGSGDGVHWALAGSGDLNANLVRLDPGHAIGEHGNDEVDVLVVVLAGTGRLTVDGEAIDLAPHVAVHVPKGARRSVAAGEQGLAYLTTHRRRGPPGIRSRPAGPVEAEGPAPDEGGEAACWLHTFDERDYGAL